MLAYAARRSVAGRQSSPNTMLFIVAAHVGALALVMSAKMDLPHRFFDPPIKVDPIPIPPDPQPIERVKPQPEHQPIADPITRTDPQVPLPMPGPDEVGTAPVELLPGPAGGGAGNGTPTLPPQPRPAMISRGPQLLTPDSDLKPPYPLAKQAFGEEATLVLRLAIDENGHVMTVDPIGRADRTFAEAARRHIIMHWRYRPAIQNGHAVMSTTVITLAFRLDG